MDFRIADTFTDSLARLTGDEQKAVKTTAFDLQMNPAHPGMSFHRLDKARDKHFWSVRVSRDIRLIVHRTPESLLLCYVDHHDDAYHWAERRKIEVHPATGAAQIVEIRERVKEITIPKCVEVEQPAAPRPPLFADIADDDLLAYGVPKEWLSDVRTVCNDDALLALADHLPGEAAEALLELATGGSPRLWTLPGAFTEETLQHDIDEAQFDNELALYDIDVEAGTAKQDQANYRDSFMHPDAQRRFRTINSSDELERALDAPWDKWTIFLHPAQREWVGKDYSGPARVSGSAGTGKTIVALHRAVHLARMHPDSRVLLATFSDALAHALQVKLRRLISGEPRLAERIDVYAMDAIGQRLYEQAFGKLHVATSQDIETFVRAAAAVHPGHGFSEGFLLSEWSNVVDAWQLTSWEAYRDVRRLGRKTRLPESRRRVLWDIYADVLAKLAAEGMVTRARMFARLAGDLAGRQHPPFDFAVIDEAQDINIPQLRFLAALAGDRPNGLFFAGDLGQRIFQQPFSWKSQGVDIRGRSRTLHVNYRTSHQIRTRADRLLDREVADVDGNIESRAGTVSAFNGPAPEIRTFVDMQAESAAVAQWLAECARGGLPAAEMAVFVRSDAELQRAQAAVDAADMRGEVLDERMRTEPGRVAISTMHLAKGLEFRAVAVMACDDEVVPLQSRIEGVVDETDLEEVYHTERHLLYVACTRARDRLWVSGVKPVSEFLDDLETR